MRSAVKNDEVLSFVSLNVEAPASAAAVKVRSQYPLNADNVAAPREYRIDVAAGFRPLGDVDVRSDISLPSSKLIAKR